VAFAGHRRHAEASESGASEHRGSIFGRPSSRGSSYRRSCGSGRCGWSLKCRRFIRRSGRRWRRLRRSWRSGPTETLRKWVRRAVVDDSRRPGLTSEEHAEIKRLKREVAELRQANDHHVSTRATLCMRHRPRSATARRTEARCGSREALISADTAIVSTRTARDARVLTCRRGRFRRRPTRHR
jgi:transposase-like protein